jgi:hypothetical protein
VQRQNQQKEERSMLVFNLDGDPGKEIRFTPRMLINAGYTGRNQAAVQAHIEELARKGIAAPDKTPTYFPKVADRIVQSGCFEVLDETDHTGEAEFCLFHHEGEFYVTPASDHTDRKLEEVSIPKSKQIYPNVVGKTAWKLSDLLGHWDSIVVKSWVQDGDERTLYQRTELGALMGPDELINRIKALLVKPDNLEGLMIFSGTVAAFFELSYSSGFEVSLEDPVTKRSINCWYKMSGIGTWFKG